MEKCDGEPKQTRNRKRWISEGNTQGNSPFLNPTTEYEEQGSPSKSKALTDSKDSFRLSLFSRKNNDLEKNSEGYL